MASAFSKVRTNLNGIRASISIAVCLFFIPVFLSYLYNEIKRTPNIQHANDIIAFCNDNFPDKEVKISKDGKVLIFTLSDTDTIIGYSKTYNALKYILDNINFIHSIKIIYKHECVEDSITEYTSLKKYPLTFSQMIFGDSPNTFFAVSCR